VADKPATTYVVSVFDKPHWRTVLTTKDKAEEDAMEQAMVQDGVKAQIEEITPKPKR
jgi:hypothetical protein